MAFVFGAASRVYINGFDASSFFQKAALKGTADTPETTCFGAAAKTYIGGLPDATLALDGFFDGTALAADATLKSILGVDASEFVLLPGGDAFGNRGYGFSGDEKTYEIASDIGDAVKVSCEAQSSSGMESLLVAQPLTALTVTTTTTSIDNAAGTSAGLSAFLVVTAVSGTTPQVAAKIQHSTDNSTFTDLVAFSNVTTANQSQRVSVAGTVNRYVRALLTISGTTPSLTCWVGFSRK